MTSAAHPDNRRAAAPPLRFDTHAAVLALLLAWTAASFAGRLHFFWTAPLDRTVDLLFDDAYYYLGVAWHLGHGAGSKFAEPLATNGYHPLWLLLLAGLTAAFDLSKTALVSATLALTGVVQCLGLWLFDHGGTDRLRRTVGRVAIFTAIAEFPYVFSRGLETTLFVIVIPWLLRLAARREWTRRDALWVGVALSAAFLTRLDALALDVAVLLLAVTTRRTSWRHAALATLPLVLTVLVYAGVNLACFATPLPLSGQAKSIGSHFGGNLGTAADFLTVPRSVGAMLLLWGFARLTVAPRLAFAGFEVAALGAAVAMCALYYGTLSGWPIWSWYLYPNAWLGVYVTICGGYGVAALLRFAIRSRGRPARLVAARAGVTVLAAAVLAATPLVRVVRSRSIGFDHLTGYALAKHSFEWWQTSFNQQNVALVPWLAARYPHGARLAMGDRAGALGYWMPGNFSFVHLEGLVADKAFLAALAAGRMPALLETWKVDLYVTDRPRTFEVNGILGFVEPVQPRADDGPPNVLCFRAADALLDQAYRAGNGPQLRRVFAMPSAVACPAAMMREIVALRDRYDGIRHRSGLLD